MGNAVIEAQGGVVEKFEDEPIVMTAPKREKPQPRTDRQEKPKQPRTEKQPVKKEVIEKEEIIEEEPKKTKTTKKEVVKEEPKVEEVEVKEEPTLDLESMTVVDLRALAKERGLSGYSTLKKAELIDLLK
jgi:small subunit ribosomal protein S2